MQQGLAGSEPLKDRFSESQSEQTKDIEVVYMRTLDDKKGASFFFLHSISELNIMANNKQVFAIVANVAFEIPKFLSGAFNAYHIGKGRLVKAGKVGKVTAEGVKFFTTREGQAPSAKTLKEFSDVASAAKYPLTEKQGVQWPVGPNAIAWQAGQGAIGQSAFFYALCQLTNQAKPAAKVTAAAKPEAKAKQAPKVTASKPSKAKAKPVTVTA